MFVQEVGLRHPAVPRRFPSVFGDTDFLPIDAVIAKVAHERGKKEWGTQYGKPLIPSL